MNSSSELRPQLKVCFHPGPPSLGWFFSGFFKFFLLSSVVSSRQSLPFCEGTSEPGMWCGHLWTKEHSMFLLPLPPNHQEEWLCCVFSTPAPFLKPESSCGCTFRDSPLFVCGWAWSVQAQGCSVSVLVWIQQTGCHFQPVGLWNVLFVQSALWGDWWEMGAVD